MKITLSLVALICSAVVYGSEPVVIYDGVSVKGGEVEISVAPSSTIMIRLDVDCEMVKAGELARYAQKYLGTPANLIDKTSYTISSAKVAKAAADHYIAGDNFGADTPYRVYEKEDFTLPVNITSAVVNTPEEAAKAAADEIFYIRSTRREILAGDYGEGFYGGGLIAALNQFSKEEEAYSKLFFGSMSRGSESRIFNIALSGDTKRYIVCRFSEQLGVVDSSDLSAEPVTLQITPLAPVDVEIPTGDEKSTYHNLMVATQAKVELIYGGKTLATQTMPLFEFGKRISYPVSPVKR
ncbi:MAG: DUF4831 family protein [Rikenellaceae bacterium]